MGTFTPRVMRLLSDQLTGTPLREIDALFDDRGIALGPQQPRENDESVRRERMRRYLATLSLGNAADAPRLAGEAAMTDCGINGFGSYVKMASASTKPTALRAWAEP